MTPRRVFAVASLAFLTVASLDAARVRRLSLEELRDNADAVVVVKVVSSSTRPGNEGMMVWTDYTVDVIESLKGNAVAGSKMTLSFAGGSAGGADVGIIGIPKLVVDKRYLLFVDAAELRPVPVVGWSQGLFAIDKGDDGGELLVSADGETLELTLSGELSRGRRDFGKRAAAASSTSSMRLAPPRISNADGTAASIDATRPPLANATRRLATLADVRKFVATRPLPAGRVVR